MIEYGGDVDKGDMNDGLGQEGTGPRGVLQKAEIS